MTAADRIPALDVLRGCAVLGILWMNITAFALPETAYFNPAVSGHLAPADILWWAFGFVLVDGKMRALFSMLFGASILLLIDREEMAGRNGVHTHRKRMAWLFVIGIAHGILLWWGDILAAYALLSLVALPFAKREPIGLVKTAFLFFLLHFLLCALFVGSLIVWSHAVGAPDADMAARAAFDSFIAPYRDADAPSVVRELSAMRGDYGDIVARNLARYPAQWLWSLLFMAFDTIGFMLLGMAMLKSGFLTGRWAPELYLRTARHCFLIGLLPMIGLAAWIIMRGHPPLTTLGAGMAWAFPFRIPLAVGWAAFLLWLFTAGRGIVIAQRLASVGRLALSNYILSSIVMTGIFYGWGFGLFGHIRPASLPLFVLLGWALIISWSPRWDRRFAAGPLEWLWRSLSRGRMQKIRKSG
ncbi:MAG: DUF418 domain-containing protein [Sphingobium sp.]